LSVKLPFNTSAMRLIINGFFESHILNQVYIKVIEKFSIEKCHIFTNLGNTARNLLQAEIKSQVNFYDFQETITGSYSYVNWSEITPLDEATICKMAECETLVLKMMDRLSIDSVSYEERKRLYLRHLRYWNHIILHENIDLFLNGGIPHEIYDFIIYSLCRLRNIPCLFFINSPINGVVFISNDWEKEPATSVAETYNQIISQRPEKIYLSDRFRHHYDIQTSPSEDPIPWYMDSKFNPNITKPRLPIVSLDRLFMLLKKVKKALENQQLIDKSIEKLVKRIQTTRKKKLLDFYEHNTTIPDLSKEYIYVPLHYQPECSTSPMAGAFVNQILIVQMIASLIPSGIYIYVKEHPFQTPYFRDTNFYKDLLAIPQVQLISREYNSFRLIENCLAVATATGTAGWEALFRQKPVLMFGHTFYQYAPGVFSIHSLQDCRDALNKIIKDNVKPSLYEMQVFLKAMETHAVIGYTDIAYSSVSQITCEENTNNLFSALKERIMNLGYPSTSKHN